MANDTDIAALAAELRALVGRLKRRLREQGSVGDLTPSQIAALRRLEREGPATISNLARAEGVRPQSMGVTVAALEAAGLVAGAPDPSDGRQTLFSPTPGLAPKKWRASDEAGGSPCPTHALRKSFRMRLYGSL